MIYSGDPSSLDYYRKVVKNSKESSKFLCAENRNITDSINTKMSLAAFLHFSMYIYVRKGGEYMEFPIHKVVIVVIVCIHYLQKVLKKPIDYYFYYHKFFVKSLQRPYITEFIINKWNISKKLLLCYFDTIVSNIRLAGGLY